MNERAGHSDIEGKAIPIDDHCQLTYDPYHGILFIIFTSIEKFNFNGCEV
jgi:hypothetical protein